MTKVSTINPQDTVLDYIHNIQEDNYQKVKSLSPQAVINYYNQTTQQALKKIGYSLLWDKKIGCGKIKEEIE